MRKKTIMLWVDDKLKEETFIIAELNQLSVSDYIRRLLIQEITKAKERGLIKND